MSFVDLKDDKEINNSAIRKLVDARCKLMNHEPFYGNIAMILNWVRHDFNFVEDEKDKKITMRVLSNNDVDVLYYPPYVDSKNINQLYGIIQHLIEHLMRLHPIRRSSRNTECWDVSTDMVVNGKKNNCRIGCNDKYGRKVLPGDNIIFLPDDFDESYMAEEVYDKIIDDFNEIGVGNEHIDIHQGWELSSISEENGRSLVESIIRDSMSQSPGSVPGHVHEILDKIKDPYVKWRDLLKQFIGQNIGNRRKTYSRRNRRQDVFGMPGISHRASSSVRVIVDTSGSVSQDMLEQFFAEIESISHKSKISLLQWDHGFQGYSSYRKGDWKNISVNGRGGTDMAAPFKWLEDNNEVGDVTIMLTDGYCSWPSAKSYPSIFVVCRYDHIDDVDFPDWGMHVKMKLNK